MDCFRHIYRLLMSSVKRARHQTLNIGSPTNFRKEELPSFFDELYPFLSFSNAWL
ncbi:hypothetical protein BJY01DRAFT_254115 [Aspergillus pseudoustus]|uniref:Uncharacterized protein n=1 Tax=Aspergillus pseudoustus TaxID=1810923 RepID=A0ABR4IVR0_9EURO